MTGETEEVPLIRVAKFEERQSLNAVNRENQRRGVTLSGELGGGDKMPLLTIMPASMIKPIMLTTLTSMPHRYRAKNPPVKARGGDSGRGAGFGGLHPARGRHLGDGRG